MRWENSETKVFSGTNANAFTEVFELKDRDGNVLKRFTKAADGSLTEVTVSITAPIARVVTGTIDTALSGTPAVLRFGNLVITTVAEGDGIPDDDDGTELIPYLAANAHLMPADNVVDNEDGTFVITFHPGANTLPVSSADAALTFEQDVEGADRVTVLAAQSVGDEVTEDELAAIQGAASPDASNVFATMADVSGALRLSTTDAVDMNTATPSTLYTVPADNIAIITNVVIRGSSVDLDTASISFGFNDADHNDVISNATHTELTGATKAKVIHPDASAVRGAAADVFKVKANTLQGEAATVSIDVFGYLIEV